MKYDKIYEINFRNLINLVTPPFLRKRKFIDWLFVLLSPIEAINISFNKFRRQSIYKVTHNGQVYSLNAVLNDSYDPSERRIRIQDSILKESTYVYPEDDKKEVWIYPEASNRPVYIYDEAAFKDINFDFLVLMPLELRPANAEDLELILIQIRSLVNYYKLASKTFNIIWI